MSRLSDVIDAVVEAPIVPSFTRLGHAVRSRVDDWRELESYDLGGRVVAITGPTSGLGLAAARQLARMGASLILIARDAEKTERVQAELESEGASITHALADLGDFDEVRRAATEIVDANDRLDVLIHNAGALFNERREAPNGLELTTAVQVVAPFLLTGLLWDSLVATPSSRVLTMSSGGMYTAGLTVEKLQMDEESYRGTEQYARAKRAQVTLNEIWAERTEGSGVRFHALHPGWADTPGVEAALPGFRKVVGPLLRSPLEGADTLVWLSADDQEPLATNGGFWHDRRIRSIHKLPSTRRTDTPRRREKLWDWVSDQAGWDLPRAG